jgi:hypothetical protein
MTKRGLLKVKVDALTDAEAAEVLDYINIMQSMKEQSVTSSHDDEALLKLLFKAFGRRRQQARG